MKDSVYFIGTVNNEAGRVKIGTTARDPRKRLNALRTASPYRLELIGYSQMHRRYEPLLHGFFEPLRVHGEWFRYEGFLLVLLTRMLATVGSGVAWDDEIFWENLFNLMKLPESHLYLQAHGQDARSTVPQALVPIHPNMKIFLSKYGLA